MVALRRYSGNATHMQKTPDVDSPLPPDVAPRKLRGSYWYYGAERQVAARRCLTESSVTGSGWRLQAPWPGISTRSKSAAAET